MNKVVVLYLSEIALLVSWKSGVTYRDQVGGHVCYQAEMEGILVPLDFNENIEQAIEFLPYPSVRKGISKEIGMAIDAFLKSSISANFISVDFSRLEESWEAWIYVNVDSPSLEEGVDSRMNNINPLPYRPVYGFGRSYGVLTWANSD